MSEVREQAEADGKHMCELFADDGATCGQVFDSIRALSAHQRFAQGGATTACKF